MVQTESAVTGVMHCSAVYPALFIVGAVVLMLFYPISKEQNYRIADELAARRKNFANADNKPQS